MLIGQPGDCSGKLLAFFARCGIGWPKTPVIRTTAVCMAIGRANWLFPKVKYSEGRKFAIVVITWPPRKGKPIRRHGHVGILTVDVRNGRTMMAHASSKWGFIIVPINSNNKRDPYYPHIDFLKQVLWND